MSALRPCPFCGGDKISTGHIRDGRSCGCTGCGASVRAFEPDAEQKCRDLWNIRPPIDMVLFCPACGDRHIDRADPAPVIMPDGTERTWHNPPHSSHLCLKCGHIWRPADVPTNGIEKVATSGYQDSPIVSPAALQAQLDATNEGAWEDERQLNAALKSLQEIADMHVGDQPAALRHYREADWVRRHVSFMQHLAGEAVKKIVADEGAKPKPVESAAEIISFGVANDIPTASIVERLINVGHLRPGSR